MTRQEARQLVADVALSAFEEHAGLILVSRQSIAAEDWPIVTAELKQVKDWLWRRAGYSAPKPKVAAQRKAVRAKQNGPAFEPKR